MSLEYYTPNFNPVDIETSGGAGTADCGVDPIAIFTKIVEKYLGEPVVGTLELGLPEKNTGPKNTKLKLKLTSPYGNVQSYIVRYDRLVLDSLLVNYVIPYEDIAAAGNDFIKITEIVNRETGLSLTAKSFKNPVWDISKINSRTLSIELNPNDYFYTLSGTSVILNLNLDYKPQKHHSAFPAGSIVSEYEINQDITNGYSNASQWVKLDGSSYDPNKHGSNLNQYFPTLYKLTKYHNVASDKYLARTDKPVLQKISPRRFFNPASYPTYYSEGIQLVSQTTLANSTKFTSYKDDGSEIIDSELLHINENNIKIIAIDDYIDRFIALTPSNQVVSKYIIDKTPNRVNNIILYSDVKEVYWADAGSIRTIFGDNVHTVLNMEYTLIGQYKALDGTIKTDMPLFVYITGHNIVVGYNSMFTSPTPANQGWIGITTFANNFLLVDRKLNVHIGTVFIASSRHSGKYAYMNWDKVTPDNGITALASSIGPNDYVDVSIYSPEIQRQSDGTNSNTLNFILAVNIVTATGSRISKKFVIKANLNSTATLKAESYTEIFTDLQVYASWVSPEGKFLDYTSDGWYEFNSYSDYTNFNISNHWVDYEGIFWPLITEYEFKLSENGLYAYKVKNKNITPLGEYAHKVFKIVKGQLQHPLYGSGLIDDTKTYYLRIN